MGGSALIGRKEGKMRKLIVVAIILAMCIMACPQLVGAATYVQIGITATGSDITISCNETDWAVGTVSANEKVWTTDNNRFEVHSFLRIRYDS